MVAILSSFTALAMKITRIPSDASSSSEAPAVEEGNVKLGPICSILRIMEQLGEFCLLLFS